MHTLVVVFNTSWDHTGRAQSILGSADVYEDI